MEVSFIIVSFLLISLLFVLFFRWTVRTYDHWSKLNVPTAGKPIPFFGNISPFLLRRENYVETIMRIYRSLDGLPYGGYYEMKEPILMIRDPDLIVTILIKDFHRFRDKHVDVFFNTTNRRLNPLSGPLFVLNGTRWKTVRSKLTTGFTVSKLNYMSSVVLEYAKKIVEFVRYSSDTSALVVIDAKDLMMKFTFDVMNACLHGTNYDVTESTIEFAKMTVTGNNYVKRFVLLAVNKKLLHLFRMADFPRDFTDWYVRFVQHIVRHRKSNVNDTTVERKDFLQTIIDIKNPTANTSDENEIFDDIDIAANAFGLFFGGYETTAGTLAFCLHELSFDPNVQDKLRREIRTVIRSDDLRSEAMIAESLKKLPYLDAVISETLRKYSLMPALFRTCTEDYVIPNSDIIIRKGTKIIIPVNAIHADGNIYEDPEKFQPDRFLPENKTTIKNGHYLPFGSGPRYCLGMRFVLMTMKIILIEIVSNFMLEPYPGVEYKISYRKGEILSIPQKKLLINMRRIKNELSE